MDITLTPEEEAAIYLAEPAGEHLDKVKAYDYRRRWDHALASKRSRAALPAVAFELPTYIASPVTGLIRRGRFAAVRDKLCADWLSDYRMEGEFDRILAALEELLSHEDYAIPSSTSASEEDKLEEEPEGGRARPPPGPPPTFMLAFAVRRHAPPTSRHREAPVT